MGRKLKRIAIGVFAAFAVALLAVYLASLRASPLVNELLRDWATSEIATQSDSVYALHVGRLHFNWPLRGVLRSCVISGINLPRLVLGRGLEASQIGCAEVHWESDAPPDSASVARLQQARPPAPRPQPAPDTSRRTESPHGAVMAFQRELDLPRRVPTIRIGRIVFPKVAIGVVARKPSGDHTRFDLADRKSTRLNSSHVEI